MPHKSCCSGCIAFAVSLATAVCPSVAPANTAVGAHPEVARDIQSRTTERDLNLDSDFAWQESVSGPLCGVFAACSAIQLLGANATPEEFVTSEYVGTCEGSSQREIIGIIEAAGYSACPLRNLSIYDLRVVGLPVVSFVRGSAVGDRYDHWVTVEATGNGVVVYDGAREPYEITTAEFLGIWSGVGVFANHKGESSPVLRIWLGRGPLFVFATGLVFAGCKLLKASAIGADQRLSVAALALLSVVLSGFGNFFLGDLKNVEAGVHAATAPFYTVVRRASLTDAVNASAEPGVMLVDARREIDHKLGSIAGSVNIPVSASPLEIQRFLRGVSKDVDIYVYCQSEHCAYDDAIAKQIASLGFKNVNVCDEGWAEYSKSLAGAVSGK